MLSPRVGKILLEQWRKNNPAECTCQSQCPVHTTTVEVDRSVGAAWSGSAYCVKCKHSVEFTGVIRTSDSGRQMAMGNCPSCGTKVNRILGKVM